MSVIECFCPDVGKANLGTLSCPNVMKTIKKHIFMDEFDSTGAKNGILVSDLDNGVLPDAFVLAKVNEADPTKRWYFTPDKYESVTSSRTDSVIEDFPSGRTEKLQDGVPNFEGAWIGVDSVLASRASSNGCTATAAFEIDVTGALRGELSSDAQSFYPMAINKGSFDASPVGEVEGSNVPRVVVKFQYSQTVIEGNFSIMNASLTETDLLKVNGLLDGNTTVLTVPAVSATTASINVPYDFITFGNPNYIQGLDVPADWELLDGVTPVAISGIIDFNGDGSRYDFTFAPSTTSTALTLNYIGFPASSTDQGFDIDSVTITTP